MASMARQSTLSSQVKHILLRTNSGEKTTQDQIQSKPQAELEPPDKVITDWKQRNLSIKIVVEIKNLASPTFNFLQRVHGQQKPHHVDSWVNNWEMESGHDAGPIQLKREIPVIK